MKIDDMLAGPAMDALVAEHVLGWVPPTREHEGPWTPLWEASRTGNTLAYYHNAKTGVLLSPDEHRLVTMWQGPIGQRELTPPLYSKDILCAWEVIIRMEREYGKCLYLEQFDQNNVNGAHWVASFRWTGWEIGESYPGEAIGMNGSTMEEAVCRAALEWIEVSTSKVSSED